jgi:hypothetical protein
LERNEAKMRESQHIGQRRGRQLAGAGRVRVRRAHGRELDAFGDGYASASGYRVEREYLARSQVFVAVRAKRVVGGFVLNVAPPFRTMLRLPEPARRSLASEFPSDDTVELACVWLAPQSRGPLASAALWARLVWHASRRGRRHVVFGTEVDRLRRRYELTGARLLYEGEVRVDGRSRHGWVYSIPVERWPSTLLRVVLWGWAPVRSR